MGDGESGVEGAGRGPGAEQPRHHLLAGEPEHAREQGGGADRAGVARDTQLLAPRGTRCDLEQLLARGVVRRGRGQLAASGIRSRGGVCHGRPALLASTDVTVLAALATPAPPDTLLTPLRAAVLGAVQGLTEFLPISSSAHLFIVPHLLGWHYEGVAFDVALHGGTLVALLVAFWRDWWNLARDAFASDTVARTEARHLWLWLILASIPAAIVGVLLEQAAEDRLRSMELQAIMLLVFGFILWVADRLSGPGREIRRPGWAMALGIGLAQVLALIPGVSRSGV